MQAVFITICSFVILLGFEIRHRQTVEELTDLKTDLARLDEEVIILKKEMKLKQNVYQEHGPS